jgi:MarR family transcriptional regulator, transcriptional regulator for hemolysin
MKPGKDSFGFLLSDVTRLFRKQFDRRAVCFGLTRAQWRAMKWLSAGHGMYQSELAEQLEMEPIAIGRVIDRLQSAGYVVRQADPADRRRWQLSLTKKAHAVLDDMQSISQGLRQDAMRGVTAAEIRQTTSVLDRIKANLLALETPANKGDAK